LHLNLWDNKLDDGLCPQIGHSLLVNKTINSLSLAKNHFADDCSQTLVNSFTPELVVDKADQANLKKLGFTSTSAKGKVFRDPNTSIKYLNLSYNKMSDAAAEALYFIFNDPPDLEGEAAPVPDKKDKKGGKGGKQVEGKPCVLDKIALKHCPFTQTWYQKLLDDEHFDMHISPTETQEEDEGDEGDEGDDGCGDEAAAEEEAGEEQKNE